jgi:hypothetical protein
VSDELREMVSRYLDPESTWYPYPPEFYAQFESWEHLGHCVGVCYEHCLYCEEADDAEESECM